MRSWIMLLMSALLVPIPDALGQETEAIPEALRPWVPWVLHQQEERLCPQLIAGAQARTHQPLCAWPGRLSITLSASGARFQQRWEVMAPSWIPLPGEAAQWPQAVMNSAQQPLVVIERHHRPAVYLRPGIHELSGQLRWRQLPESLAIPPEIALLEVSGLLDGAETEPHRDADARLWLGKPRSAPEDEAPPEPERLTLEVMRHIEDSIPLRTTTRLVLDVSGQPREVVLGPLALANAVAIMLDSPLPARLEPSGHLRLQVRPGHWVVTLHSYQPRPVETLHLEPREPPWPAHEVWVVAARPDLRRIQIEGADSLDPRQTRLPGEWQRLPAYVLKPGQSLHLTELDRGAQGRDRLSLNRALWLDFDGQGLSARDRIHGELRQRWRLEASPSLHLGQVRINDQPQFITHLPEAPQREGVEVRQGQLTLLADGRIAAEQRNFLAARAISLPASGWAMPLEALSLRLHLPPGWDLLMANGVDNVPASWLARWSLLDLFLVLIITLAVGRLYDWRWGALAFATLVLSWQQAGAPQLVWLNLLGALALLRVLPRQRETQPALSRVRTLVQLYYRATLLVLALIILAFLIMTLRTGLFPQLEHPYRAGLVQLAGQSPSPELQADLGSSAQSKALARALLPSAPPPPRMAPLPLIDPGTHVQTGAGVPDWTWAEIRLTWNGPVAPGHRIHLWLLAPAGALMLAVLQLITLTALSLRLARPDPDQEQRSNTDSRTRAPLALALLGMLGVSLLLPVQPAWAESEPGMAFPPAELLAELRQRLLKPPECLPNCASIATLALDLSDESLHLELAVDVAAHLALPVPGGRDAWMPDALVLDGEPLDLLRQDEGGRLLVALAPGRHQLHLSAPVGSRTRITLPLPTRPQSLSARLAPEWRLEGLDARGYPAEQIRLVRTSTQATSTAQRTEPPRTEAELAPLLEITRTLRLGLDWTIETRLERLSTPRDPLTLRIPLLPGEAVTTAERQIDETGLLVVLPPGRTVDRWSSTLIPTEQLVLVASSDRRLSEVWRIELSPLWHLDSEGLSPVQQLDSGARWLPTWRPWPGERLHLAFSRPQGVPGPTLTLDHSRYHLRPSRRGTEAQLNLTLRASQGGPHLLTLPRQAEPVSLRINGREHSLPHAQAGEAGSIELPLVPGTQNVELTWREPQAAGVVYQPSVVDLGTSGVNAETRISLGTERWVLWTSGPLMGPAVQFWGLLVVLALFALLLARSGLAPLGVLDWFLLGIGLSQAGLWTGALVTLWLLALGARHRTSPQIPDWRFNLTQIGLVVLTLVALVALVLAVEQGLLGSPRMQIAGNDSTPTELRWYLDRSTGHTASVALVSVSIWFYRGLMLLWSLWLALRLLDWLRWGWSGFAHPVAWREAIRTKNTTQPTAGEEDDLRLDV